MRILLFKALVALIKQIRRLIFINNCVGVVPPAPPGSLGDQALLQGISEVLTRKGELFVEIKLSNSSTKHSILGGGTLAICGVTDSRSSLLLFLWKIHRFRSFVIIGADTLDGGYSVEKNLLWIKMANLASSINIPCRIVSFSFSETPDQNVVNAIKNSNPKIEFCSRDPVSQKRFIDHTHKKCRLVADLAFLMSPCSKIVEIKNAKKWVDEKKKGGALIIGVNANSLGMSDQFDALVDSYVLSISIVLRERERVYALLIPHDFRNNQSDSYILEIIYNKLKNAFRDRVYLIKGPFDAWDVKYLISDVDVVITGRMHLAIAALSQGIPAYGLSYKGKFEGLMHHLKLEGNLMPRVSSLDKALLGEFIFRAVSEHQVLKGRLEKSLPAVKKLARGNYP